MIFTNEGKHALLNGLTAALNSGKSSLKLYDNANNLMTVAELSDASMAIVDGTRLEITPNGYYSVLKSGTFFNAKLFDKDENILASAITIGDANSDAPIKINQTTVQEGGLFSLESFVFTF